MFTFFNRRIQARGATAVEAALTLPIFLGFVLILLDLGGYFFSYCVLSYAAHSAVQEASKLELEEKTDPTSCAKSAEFTQKCKNFRKRVLEVLSTADDIADLVSSTGGNGRVIRRQFQHFSAVGQVLTIPGEQASSVIAGAALLRPGEQATASDGTILTHVTRPFVAWPEADSVDNWSTRMAQDPLQVSIQATYQPLTPLFERVPINITALAFRKTANFARPPRYYTPSGGGSAALTPSPTPDPATLPTATATATPLPVGWCDCCHASPPCNDIKCFTCFGRTACASGSFCGT